MGIIEVAGRAKRVPCFPFPLPRTGFVRIGGRLRAELPWWNLRFYTPPYMGEETLRRWCAPRRPFPLIRAIFLHSRGIQALPKTRLVFRNTIVPARIPTYRDVAQLPLFCLLTSSQQSITVRYQKGRTKNLNKERASLVGDTHDHLSAGTGQQVGRRKRIVRPTE